jgi:probable HAF family extracellular repeat protein
MKTYKIAIHAAVVMLSAAPVALAQAPTYRVTELASPAGTACVGTAINDAGVAAGACIPASATAPTLSNSGAVVWRDGVPALVGTLTGGNYAYANAINSSGVIVGDGDGGNFRPQAFVQTPSGLLNVDPVNGGNARAIGIMDNGIIFGNLTKSLSGKTSSWNVVMWTQDKGHPDRYKETFLPQLVAGDPKFVGVYGLASNKAGQAVGWATNLVIGQLGAFWNNDAAHSIVALRPLPGGWHSIAWGLNDLGQAVGESNGAAYATRATLWQNDAAHTPVDLGTLPGDNESTAMAANSAGQVVGFSEAGTYPTYVSNRAFLWQNGQMYELSSLIDPADGAWTITGIFGINNAGQIVAIGMSAGRSASIVLTPAIQ